MIAYWFQITPQGPLALNDETDETNFQRSRDAIPGGTLRGAVARLALEACFNPAFLERHHDCPERATCPFWQLFGEPHAARFGYAYPAYFTPADAFPLPLTAHACKMAPGLPPEGRRPSAQRLDPPHGVWDMLLWRFVETLAADPAFPRRQEWLGDTPADLKVVTPTCPVCGADLTPFAGWAYLNREGSHATQARVMHRWQAHVGINRARFVAQPGLFFVQELTELPQGWSYYAPVWLTAEQEAALRDLLARHPQGFVGGGRSRGYGRVTWRLDETPRPLPPLEQRLLRWTMALHTTWEARFPNRPLPEGTIVPLTLRSPALLEAWGRPYLVPTPEDLGLPEASLLLAWTRPEVWTGWHEAAHLPRTPRQVAAAGSVYLFHIPAAPDDPALLAALEALETRGLGEERARGLGEVVVAHPWHTLARWQPALVESPEEQGS